MTDMGKKLAAPEPNTKLARGSAMPAPPRKARQNANPAVEFLMQQDLHQSESILLSLARAAGYRDANVNTVKSARHKAAKLGNYSFRKKVDRTWNYPYDLNEEPRVLREKLLADGVDMPLDVIYQHRNKARRAGINIPKACPRSAEYAWIEAQDLTLPNDLLVVQAHRQGYVINGSMIGKVRRKRFAAERDKKRDEQLAATRDKISAHVGQKYGIDAQLVAQIYDVIVDLRAKLLQDP